LIGPGLVGDVRQVFIDIPNQILIQVIDVVLPDANDELSSHIMILAAPGHSEYQPLLRHALQKRRQFPFVTARAAGNGIDRPREHAHSRGHFRLLRTEKPFQYPDFHTTLGTRIPGRQIVQVFGQAAKNVQGLFWFSFHNSYYNTKTASVQP